jgi:hypothetical protein
MGAFVEEERNEGGKKGYLCRDRPVKNTQHQQVTSHGCNSEVYEKK